MRSEEEATKPGVSRRTISILVPTLNEVDNINELLSRIFLTLKESDLEAEVLIVDGGSTDGTQGRVREWTCRGPVRLVQLDGKDGLAGDVIGAARLAAGEIITVLDGDLSHPPEVIPLLVGPVFEGTHDLVIGSRHVGEGRIEGWPFSRWLISQIARSLVRPLVDVEDPLSGCFAVSRSLLLRVGENAAGFKILLQLLTSVDNSLRVAEVPIVFKNRTRGISKLGFGQVITFLRQLIVISGGGMPKGYGSRLLWSAGLGFVLDLILFRVLFVRQSGILLPHLASFSLATVLSYGIYAQWTFAQATRSYGVSLGAVCCRFFLIYSLAILLRTAVIAQLVESWSWHLQTGLLIGALAGHLVLLSGMPLFVFGKRRPGTVTSIRWRVIAMLVVVYTVLLRLAFMGPINLMPEEAYYWNYAQHLDLSYFDHPPMVAWLIWTFTSLLGKSELSVRLPALMCWAIAAGFMYRLTLNLFERNAAFRSVLLMAVLPIYLGFGFFMTPDAPLLAAWSGCLYFLERALIAQRRTAWWGVGIFIGLGMLSKYTMALTGLATLVYLLVDQRSRRWWFRKEPYLAALLALLLFAPVLIWNAEHGWASFVFQGPHRWSGRPQFSVHLLVGMILLLLTPIGLAAVLKVFLPTSQAETAGLKQPWYGSRQRLFGLVFTTAPLFVFVAYSFLHEPKFNWTGPVWLAAIPLVAWDMVPRRQEVSKSLALFLHRMWLPLIGILLLIHGSAFYYISLGLPGTGPMLTKRTFGPWRYLGEKVEAIERDIEATTRSEPLIVGMDRYFISSQLAFYDLLDNDGALNAGGAHLFGGSSLMWAYWFPRERQVGRDILMIDFDSQHLMSPTLSRYFERMSDVFTEAIEKNGRVVGYFHWRVGYNYLG